MSQQQQIAPKNSKAANVPVKRDNFYKLWLTFMTPLHKLTAKSVEVAAELLKERKRLSKVISDTTVLYKNLFSVETKNYITSKCKITSSNYYVIMGKLRTAGFIIDNTINIKFIPDYNYEGDEYHLHIMFHLHD